MDSISEKKIRKKFIISFWITSVLSIPLFFLAGVTFVSMQGFNFLFILFSFWPLILLYWISSWLLLNLSYKRRGNKYLLFCLGMQLITLLGLAALSLIFLIGFKSQSSYEDIFYPLISLTFILGCILSYFSINCLRLYKLNKVDGKYWKEAIKIVSNTNKKIESTEQEIVIRKKFITSLFLLIPFLLINRFLNRLFPLISNIEILKSDLVDFSLGLLPYAIFFFFAYYFGYKKRGTQYLLGVIISLGMTSIYSFITVFRSYFIYSELNNLELIFTSTTLFLTIYFIYNCAKLCRFNFIFIRSNTQLIEKIAEEKKQQTETITN